MTQALNSGQALPLSLGSGDFNQDGIADVVIGYSAPGGGGILSVRPGNLDAFAPQSTASWQAISQGQFPSPLLSTANAFQVPSAPNFVAVGRFAGTDHDDVVVAARGDSTLYVLPGNGHLQFGSPQATTLPSGVTAVVAGRFGSQSRFTTLLVGVGGAQPKLLVYSGSDHGLTLLSSYALPAAAVSLTLSDMDGDFLPDGVMVCGGQVLILHSAQGANPRLETLSLPLSASSVLAGFFVHDRTWRQQLAILAPDGSINIVAHGGFDPRGWTQSEVAAMWDARLHHRPNPFARSTSPAYGGWHVIETLASVAPFSGGGTLPLLSRARISAQGTDDVMVINPDAGQLVLVSHANVTAGASTFVPGQLSTKVYSAGTPVAAMPLRVNIDARPGLVLLHQADTGLYDMMPLPDPTFFVNRTDDPAPGVTANNCNNSSSTDTSSSCSLRQAVMKANASTGQDTIVLPAGTFQLTIPSSGTFDASSGHLDINDGVNIMGQGPSSTIIQAANGDQVLSILDLNPITPDPSNQGSGIAVSISGLAIAGGNGSSALLGGGGIAWDAGTDGGGALNLDSVVIGALNLNSVVINGNSAPVGGGLALSNFGQNPDSNVTISNSTIDSNTALAVGGGISVTGPVALTLTNAQVINNNVLDANAAANGSPEQGGGLFLSSSNPTATRILGSIISGNSAGSSGLGEGGGIWTTQALEIGQGTTISSNQAGASGGGVWIRLTNSTDAVSVTASTITNNQAGADGGGIQVDATNAGAFTMLFSRIVGNSSGSGGNGLNNASTASVVAGDNWWGCNAGPTVPSSGCDLVQGVTPGSIVTSFISATPASLLVGTNAQVTAGLQDANPQFSSNLAAFVNLPISIQNAVNGTLSKIQTTVQGNGSATATFTATAYGAGSVQVVNFDRQTLTASIAIQHFSVSAAPPLQSVNGGSSATAIYTGTVTSLGNFAGTVNLSCSVLPASGVSVNCPPSVSVPAGQSVNFSITANTDPSAPAGVYSIAVTGTATAAGAGGMDSRGATVSLDVANFTVVPAQPKVTVNAGSAANPSDVLTLASLGGFSGAVALTCTPPGNQGITASCSPASVSLANGGSATSTLSLSTSASTPAGQYPIAINAVGAGITVATSVNLVVADFSVSVSPPSQTINATAGASYTVTVSTTTGFNGPVSISCSAPGGSGITISPGCPASVTLTPSANSDNANATFTLSANTTSATSGSNTLSVSGASGSVTPGATAQLVAANFLLTPNPTTRTVNVGTAANSNYTITATAVSGYTGAIQLTGSVTPIASNPPTVTFTPSSIGSSGSSTMQVSTVAATPPGIYTVTVTGNSTISGTSVNITQQITVTFVVADFALTGSPASVTANAGSTTSPVTITGTPVNNFNGQVNFCPANVTGLPPGATASFSSCTINVSANSTTNQTAMTVTTPGSTTPGSYNLGIVGNTGSAQHSVPLTLNVPGFSMSVSAPGSSQTISAGSTATFNLFGQSLGGFSGVVNLQATISPAEVNGVGGPLPNLSANSINLSPSGTGQTAFSVTVPTDFSSPAATYTITVTATGGNITQTSVLTLVLNPPPPTFTIASLQGSLTVQQGIAANISGILTGYGGFNSPITETVSIISGPSLPPGALFGFCLTCSQIGGPVPPIYSTTTQFQLNPISPGGPPMASVGFTLVQGLPPAPLLPVGTYVISFTATGGGVTRQQNTTITVVARQTFTLTTVPITGSNITVTQGQPATVTVTLSDFQNIPAGTVFTLSAPNLASFGATPAFSPPTLSAPGTSTLTIGTANVTMLNQSIDFEVEASGGTVQLTQAVTLFLTVKPAPAPDFSLSISGGQTINPGDTATFTDNVGFLSGFNGSVAVSLSGVPAGASANVAPGTFFSPGSGTVTISTSSSIAPGVYTLTLTGTGAGTTHTATTTLTVNTPPPPPDFSLSISGAQTVNPGDTVTFTDSVGFLNGFSGSVSVSLSGVPAGASANVAPGAFSGSGSGTVTISTQPSIGPGTYTLTLTGSGAGTTHSATTSLTVNNPLPPPPPPPPPGGCGFDICPDQ